jgi:hypothetical protein
MLNGAILRMTEEIEVNVTFSEVSFSKVLRQLRYLLRESSSIRLIKPSNNHKHHLTFYLKTPQNVPVFSCVRYLRVLSCSLRATAC